MVEVFCDLFSGDPHTLPQRPPLANKGNADPSKQALLWRLGDPWWSSLDRMSNAAKRWQQGLFFVDMVKRCISRDLDRRPSRQHRESIAICKNTNLGVN